MTASSHVQIGGPGVDNCVQDAELAARGWAPEAPMSRRQPP